MADIVHKLYAINPITPRTISERILCWNHGGASTVRDTNAKVSVNINHVNCEECWSLWRGGVYK